MQPLKVDFLRKNYMCTFRQTYLREMRLEMLR
jgi:hypothetical protein